MKRIVCLGFFLLGCVSCSEVSGNTKEIVDSSTIQEDGCPQEPGKLETNNVENIDIDGQEISVKDQIKADKYLGYSFEGQAKQKLSYSTENELCIWVYDPTLKPLDGLELPEDGKYTVQVSVPSGSTSFELSLALEDEQASSFSNQVSSKANLSSFDQIEERPAADKFVVEHYKNLNDRNYQFTWSRLSPNFQKISSSYSDYLEWWNSVKEIKIGKVTLIEQSNTTAVVDAELLYFMNNNTDFEDEKSRIYLVWSSETNSWLFDKKSS